MGFEVDGGCHGHVGPFLDGGGPVASSGSVSDVVALDLRAQGVNRLVLDGRPLPGDPAMRFAPFTRAVG
ncbi:hypothetical protein OHS58_42305 [Amycolatopsis sp. NBC_00348]|uniref:hypothetical protein n=1 Tax=Amycolatopsis sp. NBC_00348 TaxID=2975956 RepID=UPI002E26783F